tara:strand:- start:2404 stop:2733 length:330 start_codon:yes stop_codon:yes gene_type:complete
LHIKGDKMKKLLLITLLCFSNFAMAGNSKLGEAKFKMNCKQCHGPAGMGMASYPKVSGNPVEYTIDKLKTYRSGQEVGPNSALMIMMAKPLSDTDIENLAEYLKNAKRD